MTGSRLVVGCSRARRVFARQFVCIRACLGVMCFGGFVIELPPLPSARLAHYTNGSQPRGTRHVAKLKIAHVYPRIAPCGSARASELILGGKRRVSRIAARERRTMYVQGFRIATGHEWRACQAALGEVLCACHGWPRRPLTVEGHRTHIPPRCGRKLVCVQHNA